MTIGYAGLSLALVLLQQPTTNQLIDRLKDQVFIGQVYPSGNVYVKPFSGNRAWPKELSLLPLVIDRSSSKAALVSETMPPAYIPAVEGMDDQHDPCGSLAPKSLDLSFEYLSDEFFDGMIDYCETNEEVAIYRISPSQFSYSVLGFNSDIALDNVRVVEGPRPMSAAEEQQAAEVRRQNEKSVADCTTVPAYIDSAARFLEVGIGNGLTLRLSSYKNPGCAGHLSTIYLIDIIRANTVITTFHLVQNHGVL